MQEMVYDCVCPLIGACLEGYNGTVLAYGQTVLPPPPPARAANNTKRIHDTAAAATASTVPALASLATARLVHAGEWQDVHDGQRGSGGGA